MKAAFSLTFLSIAIVLACGSEDAPENPDSFAFAVFGDAPYAGFDELRIRRMIKKLNADELAWVLHVGDILWYPCSDEMFIDRFDLFQQIEHPFIYTPGDNEWTDCYEDIPGNYQPLDRLSQLRKTFFAEPGHSLGDRTISLKSQGENPGFEEFVENARWVYHDIVFATIHVVGSANARYSFPGRSEADDLEADRREAAVIAWLRETFKTAQEMHARAVCIAMHAAPAFEVKPGHPDRKGFEAIIAVLEEEVERFRKPVLLIHGDNHVLTIDKPLSSRTTGRRLKNFTRLEVYGSPRIGWVKVVVDTTRPEIFDFQTNRVYWIW